ncbi:MAG: NMD3-related protein [Candidatus Micrarchaeota archaeon]|nr:NMD3-related protein [Candidatus Micrarchaeota archaeon]
MPFSEKICPACGASSRDSEFSGNFCSKCYSERAEMRMPARVELSICKRCGKMGARGWSLPTSDDIEALVLSRCKGDYDSASAHIEGEFVNLEFTFIESGKEFAVKRTIPLKLRDTTCTECSRKAGGYYEAIIQIRGEDEEKIKRMEQKISRLVSRSSFISKTNWIKEGVDLYAGSKRVAEHVISNLGFKYSKSDKLAGVKDGRRIYRRSLCVRV